MIIKYLLKPTLTLLFALLIFFNTTKSTFAITCSARPTSGNATIDIACAFPNSIDGLDAGTGTTNTAVLTLTTGGTLTVTANQTLAVGSISLAGGSIVTIGSGAQIKPNTPLYMTDSDADGYPDSISTQYITSATGRVRRSTIVAFTADCNDNMYSTSNVCCAANGSACGSDGACCSSVCATNADSDGYFSQAAGHTGTCKVSALPYTDCNDSNASIYTNRTCYNDADNDGYRTTATATACTNGTDCTTSLTTYKRESSAPIDCDDTNASKYIEHESCVSCNCTCTQRLTTNGCGNCANTTYSCVGYCWTGATCLPSGSCIYCPVTSCDTCCTTICGT